VTRYSANIFLKGNARETFDVLKRHFTTALGAPDKDGVSALGLWARWNRGGSGFEITATIFSRDECYMHIFHEPDKSLFSRFLETEYTRTVKPYSGLRYLVFDGAWSVFPSLEDYKAHPHVRYTPEGLKPLLQTPEQLLVWKDDRSKVFGVGNVEYAHIIESTNVKCELKARYFNDKPKELGIAFSACDETMKCRFYAFAEWFTESDAKWSLIHEQLETLLSMKCHYTKDMDSTMRQEYMSKLF
jgi:hypothetical protein